MNIEAFRVFLKRGGRSKSAADRCVRYVQEFKDFLEGHQESKTLRDATSQDLEDFVTRIEREPKASVKGHLWSLAHYFEYSSNEEMRRIAGILREQRIKRSPFRLKDFRGVNPKDIEKLEAAGIKNVNQMLKKGRRPQDRKDLSQKTGVSSESIFELVKLSDLARIPGVKGVRARLYVDAGVDSIEQLAQWEPSAFRDMIVEFVERTGFDGIPTLPAEARYTIEKAKKLPKIVEAE